MKYKMYQLSISTSQILKLGEVSLLDSNLQLEIQISLLFFSLGNRKNLKFFCDEFEQFDMEQPVILQDTYCFEFTVTQPNQFESKTEQIWQLLNSVVIWARSYYHNNVAPNIRRT